MKSELLKYPITVLSDIPAILASISERAIEIIPVFFLRTHPIAIAAARNTSERIGYNIFVFLPSLRYARAILFNAFNILAQPIRKVKIHK